MGKTIVGITKRFSQHIDETRKGKHSPKCLWIRKYNYNICIRTVCIVGERDWKELEKYYIQKFKERGHRLLNLTDGGGMKSKRLRCSNLSKYHNVRNGLKRSNKHGCPTVLYHVLVAGHFLIEF